ncbi:hypothetical protein ACEQUB_p01034 (plasmid) [Ralstonia syzygii]
MPGRPERIDSLQRGHPALEILLDPQARRATFDCAAAFAAGIAR